MNETNDLQNLEDIDMNDEFDVSDLNDGIGTQEYHISNDEAVSFGINIRNLMD